MKNLKSVVDFFTLSEFSSLTSIEGLAKRHHKKWSENYAKWSYESTKQKLLSAYWTRVVPVHIFTLFCIGLTACFFFVFRQQKITESLTVISIAAVIVYFSLWLWVYKPVYMNEFVPLLNNAIETLSGAYLKELDDVKKAQYSSITIVLIHIVTNKLAGLIGQNGYKFSKEEMARLYGISERSFHDALSAVLNADWKESTRMNTEMADAFRKAGHYFSATGNMKAVSLLSDIQADLLVSKKPPAI
ncbi:hypothetical protein GWC95_07640 [Sediminibacterium roseum]|uniref:Uncharacterized protein n=1 Tax=Sediminibacterium roseum TaxID=1978412 RepID=A0ABW9ZU48_9BACT|nr:hypothetical protein [Sediminibacterium roseum]NCI49789.1 hypothetical protein [Sediminibacterium roseum]